MQCMASSVCQLLHALLQPGPAQVLIFLCGHVQPHAPPFWWCAVTKKSTDQLYLAQSCPCRRAEQFSWRVDLACIWQLFDDVLCRKEGNFTHMVAASTPLLFSLQACGTVQLACGPSLYSAVV